MKKNSIPVVGLLVGVLGGCLAEFPAAPGFDGAVDGSPADRGADGPRDALVTDGPRPLDAAPGTDAGVVPTDAGRDAAAPDMAPVPDLGERDAAPEDAFEVPDGCMPVDEICNGLDDNCDGRVDNLDVLQSPCRVPGRDCTGALRCDIELQAVICEPIPGAVEVCDGRDQDCDDRIDEDAQDAQGACSVGEGACAAMGRLFCQAGRPACDAAPGPPAPETCNGIDDNCNGEVDDVAGVGDACMSGVGACAQPGELLCRQGTPAPVCGAEPGPRGVETCNRIDDDCNGTIDDVAGAGMPCEVGVGACRREGQTTCLNNELRCNATEGQGRAETCNGEDDDCDTRIDEGPVCVDHALRHCKAWLAWASPAAPNQPVAQWGAGPFCPTVESVQTGTDRCTASPGDGELRPLSLGMPLGEVLDDDDALAVAFSCSGGNLAVDTWIQQHCRVVLAFAPAGVGGVAGLDPAACPASVGPAVDALDLPRCVATGTDGRFHPMWLTGVAGAGAQLGVALRCEDPRQEARARGLDGGLAVTLAYTTSNACLSGDQVRVENWAVCRGQGLPAERCVTSSGSRDIHAFILGGVGTPIDCDGLFGIGLTRAP